MIYIDKFVKQNEQADLVFDEPQQTYDVKIEMEEENAKQKKDEPLQADKPRMDRNTNP